MGNSAASPLRILVIDDNADSAEAMSLLLELAGHQVFVRHDGFSGIEEAVRCRAEVVLCGITMPGGMDGYEVATRLRAEPLTRDVRLVAVTGLVSSLDRRRAKTSGFEELLAKPFDREALFRVLRRPLSEKPSSAQLRGTQPVSRTH